MGTENHVMLHADTPQRGLALSELRVLRERVGLSQEELASQAGVTRAAIANLEHGISRARLSTANRLAEALHVTVDALADREPSVAEPRGVLSEYFQAAMQHAIYRRVGEPARTYAAIPGIPGLWARGWSREEAEDDLREALEWEVLTAVFAHRPLPAFDGVSLEIVEESKDAKAILYPESKALAEDPLVGLVDEPAQQAPQP